MTGFSFEKSKYRNEIFKSVQEFEKVDLLFY